MFFTGVEKREEETIGQNTISLDKLPYALVTYIEHTLIITMRAEKHRRRNNNKISVRDSQSNTEKKIKSNRMQYKTKQMKVVATLNHTMLRPEK